jgi:hypothetical protein
MTCMMYSYSEHYSISQSTVLESQGNVGSILYINIHMYVYIYVSITIAIMIMIILIIYTFIKIKKIL